MAKQSLFTHGYYGYKHHGCRCDACRAANAKHEGTDRQRRAARIVWNPLLVPHGTLWAYNNWVCRCSACRASHAERMRIERQQRAARLAADPSLAPHGELSTYSNWGCRCDPCRAARRRAHNR